MSNSVGCEDVRRLAPEFALGIISGDERAQVLQHLSTCSDCRQVVSELSGVADELLLLSPAQEPPAGFEGRVLARLAAERWSGKRRGILMAAAAALLAALLAAAGVLLVTREDRRVATAYRETLEEAEGRYFGAYSLRDPDGVKDGVLFVYAGEPSWIFVDIDEPMKPGEYEAQVVTTDGGSIDLGMPFELSQDKLWWASVLPVDLREIAMFRVLRADGDQQVLGARFPKR
jgi:putative zinc finger protein